MTNHYHLVIETPDAHLSKGMRQLNGVYTQTSNRRHGRTGHLFQGRYKAILIDAESYLLELTRYVSRSQALVWERLPTSSACWLGHIKQSLKVCIPKLQLGNEITHPELTLFRPRRKNSTPPRHPPASTQTKNGLDHVHNQDDKHLKEYLYGLEKPYH